METRFLATEVRSTGPKQISGRAASYNVQTQLNGFREVLARGAFSRAVKQDVVCLFNHDANCVLGRTSSGTLRLSDTAEGLDYVCDLPNTQAARDLHESIQRRDIKGCSFGFQLADGDDSFSEGEDPEDRSRYVLRTIRNISTLLDVSAVTFPQYSNTSVAARYTEASAEMRSQLASRGIVLPNAKETERIIARRKNLLSQV